MNLPFEETLMMKLQDMALDVNEWILDGYKEVSIDCYRHMLGMYIDLFNNFTKLAEQYNEIMPIFNSLVNTFLNDNKTN